MTLQELKASILEVVRTEGDATFSRLDQLEGFTGGDRTIGDSDKNIIVWDGMTDDAVTALLELQEEGRIKSKTANFFAYMFDGGMLTLPLVKKPPAKGYKKPHWQPVVLVPGSAA